MQLVASSMRNCHAITESSATLYSTGTSSEVKSEGCERSSGRQRLLNRTRIRYRAEGGIDRVRQRTIVVFYATTVWWSYITSTKRLLGWIKCGRVSLPVRRQAYRRGLGPTRSKMGRQPMIRRCRRTAGLARDPVSTARGVLDTADTAVLGNT